MIKIRESEALSGAGHQPAEVSQHERVPTGIKRILVPTDLTKESNRAIEFGLVLAKRFGAQLTLLHAYREPYAVQYVRGPHAYDAVLEDRTYFENTLKSVGEDVRKRYAHCDVEFRHEGSVRRGPGQKSEAESSRGGEGHVGSRLETNTLGAASI